MFEKITELLPEEKCVKGREEVVAISGIHAVNGNSMSPPYPENTSSILFGMGCFWGAERLFWQCPGVFVTAVGYAGGATENPNYDEVCSGYTNHTEAVLVVYDRTTLTLNDLLKTFWQEHDPTQGMRQGNDRGTQYRSAIYVSSEEDLSVAEESRSRYQAALSHSKFTDITTEISMNVPFYFAEEYHQQYLHKVPHGYCGLAGTGVDLD